MYLGFVSVMRKTISVLTISARGTSLDVRVWRLYGLTTLNKPKSRQVYTNDGIITQNIFNAAVSTSVELKKKIQRSYIYVNI